ncbi:MAG: S8 family serine peptidase [Candidatus Margulisbacteria bacterium]|nr:S8 family serine peptidase [Candidatus Margulisiibacteriota bacterium]
MVRIIIFLLCFSLVWAEYAPNKVLVKLRQTDSRPGAQNASASIIFPEKIKKILDSQGSASVQKAFEPLLVRKISNGLAKSVDTVDALSGYYLAEYLGTVNVEMLVDMLQSDPAVEAAQPVYIYHTMGEIIPVTPNDTHYDKQWYLKNIHAPEGWTLSTGSAQVVVAVIDSGISMNHEDLSSRMIEGRNYVEGGINVDDDLGHGTHVAGLIAAETNNNTGIAGLAWNVKIMPLRALKKTISPDGRIDGTGHTDDIISAIAYAVNNGADIINMSLGWNKYDQALDAACAAAYDNGVVLVAAMGNDGGLDGKGNIRIVNYPAGFPGVIGVGSVTSMNNRSKFSNIGSGEQITEVAAPGGGEGADTDLGNIYSTYHEGAGYTLMRGTSMAAPLVSGLCALLKAQSPDLSPQDIRIILHNTADDLGSSGFDPEYGHGLINVYRALARISAPANLGSKLAEIRTFPNPAKDSLKFSFRIDQPVEQIEIIVYDQRGRKIATLESGPGMAGIYVTPEWDLKTDGKTLANGSYIYVVKVTTSDGGVSYGKNVLTVVR